MTTEVFAAKIGATARAMALVQEKRTPHGEAVGTIVCPKCCGTLRFNIQPSGISRGWCNTGGCLRWCQ